MPISREILDKLFNLNENIMKAGFRGGLTPDEIRTYHGKLMAGQSAGGRGMMAPMPQVQNSTGQMTAPGIPIGGFQGNSMFPNQAGSGLLQQGQQPPPMQAPLLNPAGRLMPQQMQPSLQGQQNMLAQNSPQGGYDTHIHLGSDGQVNQINLKRAIQQRIQQRGMV